MKYRRFEDFQHLFIAENVWNSYLSYKYEQQWSVPVSEVLGSEKMEVAHFWMQNDCRMKNFLVGSIIFGSAAYWQFHMSKIFLVGIDPTSKNQQLPFFSEPTTSATGTDHCCSYLLTKQLFHAFSAIKSCQKSSKRRYFIVNGDFLALQVFSLSLINLAQERNFLSEN